MARPILISSTYADIVPQFSSRYVAVRIPLRDIDETVKELVLSEPTDELTPLLEHGSTHDYEFQGPAEVDVRFYRTGQELFFQGQMHSRVAGVCARCLTEFEFDHDPDFNFIMVPRHGRWADEALDGGGDEHMMWYEGEEVDLSPPLRERLLLSLPTLPLCREDCRGLCPRCGADRNTVTCDCVVDAGDPRLAVLRTLRRDS